MLQIYTLSHAVKTEGLESLRYAALLSNPFCLYCIVRLSLHEFIEVSLLFHALMFNLLCLLPNLINPSFLLFDYFMSGLQSVYLV